MRPPGLLFDLSADPDERNDLAAREPARVAAMAKALDELRAAPARYVLTTSRSSRASRGTDSESTQFAHLKSFWNEFKWGPWMIWALRGGAPAALRRSAVSPGTA